MFRLLGPGSLVITRLAGAQCWTSGAHPSATPHEEAIHVLELQALGLGKGEEDHGDPARVQHGEDDVRFVADVREGDGGDLHDHVVEDPVAGGGDGGASLAEAEGEDFRGVDPDLEGGRGVSCFVFFCLI